MPDEGNPEFAVHIYLLIFEFVVLGMSAHGEAECLAYDVVKRHRQKVASQREQAKSIDPIELTPLCLLLESLINQGRLLALSDGQWQVFIRRSYVFLSFVVGIHIGQIELIHISDSIEFVDNLLAVRRLLLSTIAWQELLLIFANFFSYYVFY